MACAVVFAVMLAVLVRWPHPVKEERGIAKKQAEAAEMKARGEPVPTSAYPKVEHYVAVWLRKGWAFNTMITGAMLLAAPWLGRRRTAGLKFPVAPEPMTRGDRGWTVIFCLAIMGFAAWENYPRLGLSMWGDEEFNASRFIVDEVTRKDDGAIEIKPRPWSTTLWSFRKTTNHLGFSALARLSHDTFFEKKTGPVDPWFSEALIRLPVYVAGLLFIPAMLWCGRVWGISMWFGVIIAVLHPWFVRFGVDGRAYGLVLLGVPVMLGLLGRALQTGKWRWWLLLGFAEFFVLWSYFGSIYLLVALNVAALGLIFTGTSDRPARWLLLSRWFVSGVFAKMLVIGMMAPCWPQLFEFLEQKPITGTLDWPWWRDSFSELFFGVSWENPGDGKWPIAMRSVGGAPAMSGVYLWTIFAGMAVVGIERLARSVQRRWLLVVILGAPALMLAHMAHSSIKPYAWYLAPYLPGLLLLWSSIVKSSTGRSGPVPLRELAWRWLPVLVLAWLFDGLSSGARLIYRQHPIEPSRESVALYRAVTNPRNAGIDKDVISGGFVFYTEGYDPALRRFKDVAGLRALIDEADRTRRKLFINVGMIEFARQYGFGEICRILDDPREFEHLATLPGLLPSTTREVYRWNPQRL